MATAVIKGEQTWNWAADVIYVNYNLANQQYIWIFWLPLLFYHVMTHDVYLVMKSLLMIAVLPIPYIWLQIIPATDFMKRKHRYLFLKYVIGYLRKKYYYKNAFAVLLFQIPKKAWKMDIFHSSLLYYLSLYYVLKNDWTQWPVALTVNWQMMCLSQFIFTNMTSKNILDLIGKHI